MFAFSITQLVGTQPTHDTLKRTTEASQVSPKTRMEGLD